MSSTYQDIVQFILDHKVYLQRLDVETEIRTVVQEVLSKRDPKRPLYVNLIAPKVGSEQWMYLKVKDLLPPHTLLRKQTDLVEGKDIDILFIDDWVLSGCNSAGSFEELLYGRDFGPINYYVCSYVGTKIAERTFRSLQQHYPQVNIHLQFGRTVPLLSEALQAESKSFPDALLDAFHEEMNPNTGAESFLVCSDYKVPNDFGSYPRIYTHAVDRTFMIDVEREWAQL